MLAVNIATILGIISPLLSFATPTHNTYKERMFVVVGSISLDASLQLFFFFIIVSHRLYYGAFPSAVEYTPQYYGVHEEGYPQLQWRGIPSPDYSAEDRVLSFFEENSNYELDSVLGGLF